MSRAAAVCVTGCAVRPVGARSTWSCAWCKVGTRVADARQCEKALRVRRGGHARGVPVPATSPPMHGFLFDFGGMFFCRSGVRAKQYCNHETPVNSRSFHPPTTSHLVLRICTVVGCSWSCVARGTHSLVSRVSCVNTVCTSTSAAIYARGKPIASLDSARGLTYAMVRNLHHATCTIRVYRPASYYPKPSPHAGSPCRLRCP